MAPTEPQGSRAEDVFAAFVERSELGEVVHIDALCAAHPDLADTLRRAHARWRAMADAFAAFSRGGRGDDGDDPDQDGQAMRAMLARLREPRDRADRYAIGSELAHGAMGRVFRARDQELGRDVALKVSRGHPGDLRQERRFLEEAQITGQLDHPGIVPIHELGLDAEGRPFFAMRLVQGRDLGIIFDLVASGLEGWTRTRALHVLLRVCEAMAYAHSKGVVHRDLKPSNVMVGRFGETYVMDWGLARVLGRADARDLRLQTRGQEGEIDAHADPGSSGQGSPLRTRDGEVVGTPAYMAPEQARGELEQVDARTDVYAIGAMLYHLLAGRMPFAAAGEVPTAAQVVARAIAGTPAALHQVSPDVPRELVAICEHAMARVPGDRYASVELLADDLRAYLEVRVVRAYEGGRWAELRKWLQRNRGLSTALGGAALALSAGLLASTHLWRTAESFRERADATAGRLAEELDRSEFERARMALRLDDAADAETWLWRQFLSGRDPCAVHWALWELYSRTSCLAATASTHSDHADRAAFVPAQHAVVVGGVDGRLTMLSDDGLCPLPDLGDVGSQVEGIVTHRPTGLVITGSADGNITVWRPADRTRVRGMAVHQSHARALAVSPDGPALVSGGGDGRVLLWRDPEAVPELLYSHPTGVNVARFSPSGRYLATSDADGGIRVCELPRRTTFVLPGSSRGAHAMSFAPDDRELWSGGGDQRIHVWNLVSRTETATLPTHNSTCRDLLHLDADTVLAGGWWRIDRWSTATHERSPLLLNGVWRMEHDPERRLLLATGESKVRLFDLSDRARVDVPGPVVAVSGNGQRAALRTPDGHLVVRGLPGGAVLHDLGSRRRVRYLQFDAAGRRLLVAQPEAPFRLSVLDVDSGRELCSVAGPNGPAFGDCCTMAEDGAEVAVIQGLTVRRFHVDTGAQLSEWTVATPEILRLAYSPDRKTLAAVSRRNHAIRFWSTADGAARDIPVPEPACVVFSPDGTRAASGSWSGAITVVDLAHGQVQSTWNTGTGTVQSLAWSRTEPRILVCAGGAGPVTFWDVQTGHSCLRMEPQELTPVRWLSLTADGETLAISGQDRSLLVDLTYCDRHIAGNLMSQAEELRATMPVPAGRLSELTRWAEAVRARPWPRLSRW